MSEIKRMPFTRAMKKTHTILLPQMLEYHSPFLQAAFEANGYHFAGLPKCTDCPSFRVSGQPCVRTGDSEAVESKVFLCEFPDGGV